MAKNSKSRVTRPALSIVGVNDCVEPSETVQGAGNTFNINIRGIKQKADNAIEVAGNTVTEAVLAALKYDVSEIPEPVMYWVGNAKVVALDFDREDGHPAVRDEEVAGFFPNGYPNPWQLG